MNSYLNKINFHHKMKDNKKQDKQYYYQMKKIPALIIKF